MYRKTEKIKQKLVTDEGIGRGGGGNIDPWKFKSYGKMLLKTKGWEVDRQDRQIDRQTDGQINIVIDDT